MSEPSMFELVLREISERFERIEGALGITGRTPAGRVIDVILARDEEESA